MEINPGEDLIWLILNAELMEKNKERERSYWTT